MWFMPAMCACDSSPPCVLTGSRPFKPERAVLHERPALALLAEAQILELAHHDVGEAVIHLRHIDIVMRHAGHRERFRRRLGQAERRQVGPLRDRATASRMALGHAHHHHRPLAAYPCARSGALITTAAPPSLSSEQSSSRNGSEIMRED